MATKPKILHKVTRVLASILIAGYSFMTLGAPTASRAASAPTAPTDFSVTSSGDGITLNWSAPSSDGDSLITGWYARIRITGDTPWSSMWVQPDLNQITFGGLTIGEHYDVAIAAINDIGTSPDAEALNILVGDAPGTVQNLAFVDNGDGVLRATWSPPTSQGSSPLTGYQFAYSPTDAESWDQYDVGSPSAMIIGLNPELYDIRVRAINSFGAGEWTYLRYQYLGNVDYSITNCQELQAMRYELDAAYTLAKDIDCTGVTFLPIGSNTHPFIGSLEGNGHTISNLSITVDGDYTGLFGMIDGAQISNFTVEGSVTGNNYTGGVIGRASNLATIEEVVSNVHVHGINYTGGLVGYANGLDGNPLLITRAVATGSVQGGEAVGGLAGYAVATSLSLSNASGIVTSDNDYAGGLVGRSAQNTISRSYATGTVVSQATRAGGLIGESVGDTISDSYARGDSSTPNVYYAGGLIGAMDTSTLERVYSSGVVHGYGIIGGLVGYNVGASVITDSFSASYVLPHGDSWDMRANNGLVGIDYANEITYSNDFFNSINANPNCTRDNSFNIITSDDCTGINLQFNETMFKTSTDSPINNWDLGGIWHLNAADFPTLSPIQAPQILCEQATVTDTTIHVHCASFPDGWGATTWQMQYKKTASATWGEVTLSDPSEAQATITGLTPGTDYQVRFRFTNDWGTGQWGRIDATTTGTAPIESITPPATPPVLAAAQATAASSMIDQISADSSTIRLNDYTDFTNGNGHQVTLNVGQIIYFYVNGERHSATVKEIGNTYVILTIASDPFDVRLSVGEAKDVSIKRNGTNDISVQLIRIQDGQVTLKFSRIKPVSDMTPVQPKETNLSYLWLLLLIIPAGYAISRRSTKK